MKMVKKLVNTASLIVLRRRSRVRGYARVARCAAEHYQDGCVGGGAWDHHGKINVSPFNRLSADRPQGRLRLALQRQDRSGQVQAVAVDAWGLRTLNSVFYSDPL